MQKNEIKFKPHRRDDDVNFADEIASTRNNNNNFQGMTGMALRGIVDSNVKSKFVGKSLQEEE